MGPGPPTPESATPAGNRSSAPQRQAVGPVRGPPGQVSGRVETLSMTPVTHGARCRVTAEVRVAPTAQPERSTGGWTPGRAPARGSIEPHAHHPSRSHTSTTSPASTRVVSSPTTSRQSARASAASRCEPGAPTAVTVPSTAFEASATELAAPGRGVQGLGQAGPHARAAGLRVAEGGAQDRPDEDLERHQRAHRVARQGHHRDVAGRAVVVPEPLRHARLHRDLGERDPAIGEGVLDHLVGPRADPARGEDEVDGVVGTGREGLVEGPEELLDVVGHEAQELGDRARVGHRRGEHRPVRLVDLAVAQRLARGDELGAGGEHQHPRSAAHRERPGADGRGEPDLGGAEHRARGQHDLARGDVLAGDPHVLPGGDRPVDPHPVSVPASVHSTCTTASAPSGIAAPVMIRWAVPPSRAGPSVRPAGMSAATGSVGGQVRQVGAAHRVAVHRRVRERRQRHRGDEVLGEDPPERPGQRHRLRRRRPQQGGHGLGVLGDRPHGRGIAVVVPVSRHGAHRPARHVTSRSGPAIRPGGAPPRR